MGQNAFSYMIDSITKLLATNGDKFVSLGRNWAHLALLAAVPLLVVVHWNDMKAMWNSIAQTITRYAIVMMILAVYSDSTPIPLVGVSFPSVFTGTGAYVADLIDMSIMDQVYAKSNSVISNVEPVSFTDRFNPMAWLTWFTTIMTMSIQQGIILCVISVGWVVVGVARLLGPIPIALFIFPTTTRLMFSWMMFLLQYSFYPVTANAVVYVMCQFWMHFFQDYTGPMTSDYIAGMILILLAFLITNVFISFKIPGINRDLFSGSSGVSSMLGIGGWRG